jgi:hypothetical protein
MNIEEFIKIPHLSNHYIRFGPLNSYTMKGYRVIEGERRRTITRGNTTNVNRSDNIFFDSKAVSTGYYRRLDQHTHMLARHYNFEVVLVENVLNDFLPGKLIDYGYKELPKHSDYDYGPPSFYKFVGDI